MLRRVRNCRFIIVIIIIIINFVQSFIEFNRLLNYTMAAFTHLSVFPRHHAAQIKATPKHHHP